jgi:hypothetical protein
VRQGVVGSERRRRRNAQGEECGVRTRPLSPIQATPRPLPLPANRSPRTVRIRGLLTGATDRTGDERQSRGRPLVRERPTSNGEVSDVRTGGAIYMDERRWLR